ncbi:hypothetical protein RI845_16800 [Thalassotalea nanhaiensis]|uniref:Uncharacterized protein n=1 Tax=Thalassotalea nanhaiensis TaxID=3065648 RepID=A0ABY9THF5_9GAMM|nr:hypothetical protein RI845_16800 [Colwelliaceae bacterium SQ345]
MKITPSISPCLKWFLNGHHLDFCVDVCGQFGHTLPSVPDGNFIKKGNLRDLQAKGYITKENTYIFGVQYSRFTITEFAKKFFKGNVNDFTR